MLFEILQWSVVSMYLYRVMDSSGKYQVFVDIFGILLYAVSQFQLGFVENSINASDCDLTMATLYWMGRIPTFVVAFYNLFLNPLTMERKLGAFLYELIISFLFSGCVIMCGNEVD